MQLEDLPSIFCVARRLYVEFSKLSMPLGTFRQLPSTLRAGRRPFDNFNQLSAPLGDLRRIKASPCCVGTSCVTFACVYINVVRLCKQTLPPLVRASSNGVSTGGEICN